MTAVMPRLGGSLALALMGLWMVQVYSQQMDMVLMPLNLMTAQASAAMLSGMGFPMVQEQTLLTHAAGFSGDIDYACTALIPATLLAAAILPWPASWQWRLMGVLVGTALVILLNQLRIVSLVFLGVRESAWFDVAHLWLWPVALMLVTVSYWYGWTRVAEVKHTPRL